MTNLNRASEHAAVSLRAVATATATYCTSRRGILALAALVVAAGLAFNWSWLVAVGIAPILVSIAPCAVMCALGLCMRGMHSRSCATELSKEQPGAPRPAGTEIGDKECQPRPERKPIDA